MEPTLPCGHFYGEILVRRELTGLILTETHHAPGLQLPRHAHENAYFCLVRQGTYTETYGSRTRACGPLTVAFHPPGERHSEQISDTAVRSLNIEVQPWWWKRVSVPTSLLEQAPDFQGGPVASLALRLYQELRQPDDVSPLAIEGLTLELLAEATRAARQPSQRQPPRWLERARAILHDRFTETLSLAEIATEVGVHPVHLASVFRRYYRGTIGAHLRQLRIDFACRALATSTIPLLEIAVAAGFADQSHFSTTFKRQTGLTPAAYRKAFRSP